KHGSALINITKTPLGKQMLSRLKIDAAEIEHQTQCTSCHSNPHWIENHDDYADLAVDIVSRESGVTCESCHGASSGWDLKHSDSQWRVTSPTVKAQHGMTDIRNPVTRAETCFSCHIGNVEQGKVVTHDMYAAGHPPLPSVELDAFIHQMPPHWKPLAEKGAFEHKDEFARINRISKVSAKPRDVVLHAAVAYRASLQLVAGISKQPTSYPWPELGVYDCYGCHHELKTPSWRSRVIPGILPGRPQFQLWPHTLLALVDPSMTELTTAAGRITENLNQTPFGNAQQISADVEPTIAYLSNLIEQLQASPGSLTSPNQAILALCKVAEQSVMDFESARQISWALQTIYAVSDLKQDAQRMPKIEAVLADLDKQLMLTFPAGPANPSSDNLQLTQHAVSDYDPALFRQNIQLIKQLVSDRK
ncbi:MAG: hypothetical protein NZ777_08215, partial [Pseudomonadales bacterium]|nr:hypothetical protein [Pseudomonadales bacterium]